MNAAVSLPFGALTPRKRFLHAYDYQRSAYDPRCPTIAQRRRLRLCTMHPLRAASACLALVATTHPRNPNRMTRPIDSVLARLQRTRKSGNSWIACCPAHEDRSPSLSVSSGRDDAVLLKCHGGCGVIDIVHAIGLELRDLFPKTIGELHQSRQSAFARRRK